MKNQTTPFEKACKKSGIDPNLLPGVTGLPEADAKHIIASYKLRIIHKAAIGTWVPDFNNYNQLKYTGWLVWSASAGGFVYTYTIYTDTNTYLGARFWFETRDAAKKFTMENIDLINDLHN